MYNRKLFFILAFLFLLASCNNNRSGSGRTNSGARQTDEPSRKEEVPDKPAAGTIPGAKADYNIYIENSGSMFGYVTRPTHFTNSIYELITDLDAKGVAGRLNLYFINDSICPQKPDADPKDIQSFIRNLHPQTLENSGCGVTDSQLPDIIKQVVGAAPDKVSILISDCIFSNTGGNSAASLDAAKNSLELFLSRELGKHDFSSIIVKLNSPYYGKYWIESANRTKRYEVLNGQSRPYYMLIFGRQGKLAPFLDRIRFREYTGYENSHFLLPPSASHPRAQVIRNNKIGDFRIEQPATQLVINHAETGGRNANGGDFQFSLAADLSGLSMEENYLSNPANYALPPNYSLVSVARTDPLNNESQAGYTHLFTLKTNDLKQNQEVSIRLRSKLPDWVSRSSNTDDSNPFDAVQQKQTFGLEYLVRGMAEAYADKYEGQEQLAINIQVSKDNYAANGKSGGGFPWWTIIAGGILVGVIIWLKNKK